MLKSTAYKLAQYAVVNSLSIRAEEKVEILRVLMEQEDLETYMEQKVEGKEE